MNAFSKSLLAASVAVLGGVTAANAGSEFGPQPGSYGHYGSTYCANCPGGVCTGDCDHANCESGLCRPGGQYQSYGATWAADARYGSVPPQRMDRRFDRYDAARTLPASFNGQAQCTYTSQPRAATGSACPGGICPPTHTTYYPTSAASQIRPGGCVNGSCPMPSQPTYSAARPPMFNLLGLRW